MPSRARDAKHIAPAAAVWVMLTRRQPCGKSEAGGRAGSNQHYVHIDVQGGLAVGRRTPSPIGERT
jgi:hypothetical protein